MGRLFELLFVAFLVAAVAGTNSEAEFEVEEGIELESRLGSIVLSEPISTTPPYNKVTTFPKIEAVTSPGATVELRIFSNALQPLLTADGDGKVTWTPDANLADGSYSFRIRANDGTGYGSTVYGTLKIDTDPPALPVITFPVADAILNAKKPRYTGTAESKAVLTFEFDGTVIVTATPIKAATSGTWAFTQPDSIVTETSHTLRVRATDAAGNDGPWASVTFTSDFTGPNTVLEHPTAALPTVYTSAQDYTIDGTVDEADSPKTRISFGTASIDVVPTANGPIADWTHTATSIPEGTYNIRARSQDVAGNFGPYTVYRKLIVDRTDPVVPEILIPTPDGTWKTKSKKPRYSGTAEANVFVDVWVSTNGNTPILIGRATANSRGEWGIYQPTDLLEGAIHEIKAKAIDRALNEGLETTPVTFETDYTGPAAPSITWPPGLNTATGNREPKITGSGAPANALVQVAVGSKTYKVNADASGDFEVVAVWPERPVGTYSARVRAYDDLGNYGPYSPSTTSFKLTAQAPAVPTILFPTEGSSAPAKPHFSGTADPNSWVKIFIGGILYTPAFQADGDGKWEFSGGDDVSLGYRALTVQGYYFDTTLSAVSSPRNFAVVQLSEKNLACICNFCGEDVIENSEQWCQHCETEE